MGNKKGVSLVELIIVLGLSSILLTGALYLFTNFISQGFGQQRAVSSTSRINRVFTQIKWDILMAGFSLPADRTPLNSATNTGFRGSDSITMRSLLFRGQMEGGKWSYILSPVTANTNVLVRRWNDSNVDLSPGDLVVFITPLRHKINGLFKILDRDTTTSSTGEPAFNLTLNKPLSASKVFVFAVEDSSIASEINYSVKDGKLMRNDAVLLQNVENFQVKIWIDKNQNQQPETGEWYHNLSILQSQPTLSRQIRLIKAKILVSSKGEKGYKTRKDSLIIGDNTVFYNKKNRRRNLWGTKTLPRNLNY